MTMAVENKISPRRSIAPSAAIGAVQLTVSDLERSQRFYERVLGMGAMELNDGAVGLGVAGASPLLELRGDSTAPARDPRLTGLFHLAVLVPTRHDLAVRLTALAQSRWPLSGASDHLVSEALYLDDPDGNGIEIYRDRPRPEWPRDGSGLRMATLPLDLDDVLSELGDDLAGRRSLLDVDVDTSLPSGTTIGHMHLQVSDLDSSEEFWSGILGFDVMVRGYPGALFVSAGGYHHHIGLNTWRSLGAGAPPDGAVGLRSFEVRVGDERSLADVLARVTDAGLPTTSVDGGTLVRDPSGNGVLLRA